MVFGKQTRSDQHPEPALHTKPPRLVAERAHTQTVLHQLQYVNQGWPLKRERDAQGTRPGATWLTATLHARNLTPPD